MRNIEFWIYFFIENSIQLQKMILKGKINWVTSSHLQTLNSKGCKIQHPIHWGIKFMGWNEPTVASAPIQDEALRAGLGMNQKHNFFPCPRFFQLSSLPQNFPLLLTSPLLPTSPHFALTPSTELKRAWNKSLKLEAWSRRAKMRIRNMHLKREGKSEKVETWAWS